MSRALGHGIGFLNPLLNEHLAAEGACRDIVRGSDDTTGTLGGYAAGPGWSSPIPDKLLDALCPSPSDTVPPTACGAWRVLSLPQISSLASASETLSCCKHGHPTCSQAGLRGFDSRFRFPVLDSLDSATSQESKATDDGALTAAP